MLGNLFPSLFGGNGGQGSSLDVGNRPQMLNGNEKQTFVDTASVPEKVTATDVNNMARRAGESEADVVLIKEWSEKAIADQKANLAKIEARINHSQQSMQNTKEFQKKMARHGKNIHEFQIQTQATQQNFDAYESRFNNVNIEL